MSPAEASLENGGPPGVATIVVGIAMVLIDVAVVYALLVTSGLPATATYGGTALVVLVIGGSFLAVVGRRLSGSAATAGTDPSPLTRVSRVVVSITVLTGVTVLLGYGGGLLLALSAALGGPDPTTADGALLRDRLLEWPERNRQFLDTNGHGAVPLRP
ncbi:hypothetical protein GCM10028857_23720 [Salinarchaeum chitinilyticum]